MTAWTEKELDSVDRATLIRIAGLRPDGSRRKPTTIGVVRVGDEIYVRSITGPGASWFRGTQQQGQGHIEFEETSKEVIFTPDSGQDAEVDSAYHTKYGTDRSVKTITSRPARSTTLRIDPR